MPTDLPLFAPDGISWSELGAQGYQTSSGDALSGQVSAIAVDLDGDPTGNLVYVGSASGGLWKSTNGRAANAQFKLVSDRTHTLSVGAIALDASATPTTIYVGTGAPDNAGNISSYTGAGVLISKDDGHSWRLVSGADGGLHPFAGMGFSRILVDPNDPGVLLASTGLGADPHHPPASVPQGNRAFDHLGIYRSADYGSHWTRVKSADYGTDHGATRLNPEGFFHIDLLFEPRSGKYFAGVSLQGLFVSIDRGASWALIEPASGGLPAAADTHRFSLATREGTLFALVMTSPGPDAFTLLRSDDAGENWRSLPLHGSEAGLFDNKGFLMFVAAPPASNALVIGTDALLRCDDVTRPKSLWVQIGQILHTDQHAIAFANARVWYVGNDGGAWVTSDGGANWTNLNRHLRTTQILSAAADSGTSETYVSGLMDDGSAILGAGNDAWSFVQGSDGAYCTADPSDPAGFFISRIGDDFSPVVQYVKTASSNVLTDVFTGTGDQVLMMPYEVLSVDPMRFADSTRFPRFNFDSARILLVGATDLFLVAFNPLAAPGYNTAVAPLTSFASDAPIDFIAPGTPPRPSSSQTGRPAMTLLSANCSASAVSGFRKRRSNR
jgi:hypothetical protein